MASPLLTFGVLLGIQVLWPRHCSLLGFFSIINFTRSLVLIYFEAVSGSNINIDQPIEKNLETVQIQISNLDFSYCDSWIYEHKIANHFFFLKTFISIATAELGGGLLQNFPIVQVKPSLR
jgi:hypothetical protein